MTGILMSARPSATAPTGRHLNRLRAGVLGANDGIVSVAAIVVGVAGATSHNGTILLVGLAALIGGAISMALGEYVSVSSQRDSQRAAAERFGQATPSDEDEEAGPWSAAFTSFVSFAIGGLMPVVAMLLLPAAVRIPGTFVVVMLALAATGASGARLGGARPGRATLRVLIGGTIALAATFTIGHILGTGPLG